MEDEAVQAKPETVGGGEPSKRGVVEMQILSITESLTRQSLIIETLYKKLSPIMPPAVEGNAKAEGSSDSDGSSIISVELRNIKKIIKENNQAISMIKNSVEL